MTFRHGFSAWILLLFMFSSGHCMKQDWEFDHEDRNEFFIEHFGFSPGAKMKVQVKDVEFNFPHDSVHQMDPIVAGLLFIHEKDMWDVMEYMQGMYRTNFCIVHNRSQDVWINLTDIQKWNVSKTIQLPYVVNNEKEDEQDSEDDFDDSEDDYLLHAGFYYLMFAQCTKDLEVSFKMHAEFKNPNENYLSAGDSPLPSVYLLMSLLFFVSTIVWLRYLRDHVVYIHSIHHMMTVLVLLKTFSLFVEAMRFCYMNKHGDTLTSWTTVYYIFMFLKGIILFVVILLIGTGWSLLKPHLSDRDKYVISFVLIFQVMSNTAMVVLEETSVGTQAWTRWRDVLHVMDICCCFAILFPIIWSIRNLKESATIDGKAHINLIKLTQFRSFYLIVVFYVYFTRIVLYLLAASLPYNATWVSVFVGELVTVLFYGLAGYKFRPLDQHPYLEVSTHIQSLDEFGLDDDDIELTVRKTPSSMATSTCTTAMSPSTAIPTMRANTS